MRLRASGECPLRSEDLIAELGSRRGSGSAPLRIERCTRCRTQATIRTMPALTMRLLGKGALLGIAVLQFQLYILFCLFVSLI